MGRPKGLLSDTMLFLVDLLGWLLLDVNQLRQMVVKHSDGDVDLLAIAKFSDVVVPMTLAGIQLVLLLWVARCIAAAKCMLPGAGGAVAEDSSSATSSGGGNGRGGGGSGSSHISMKGRASGSSSSSGGGSYSMKLDSMQLGVAEVLPVTREVLNRLALAGVLYWCCLFLWQDTPGNSATDERPSVPLTVGADETCVVAFDPTVTLMVADSGVVTLGSTSHSSGAAAAAAMSAEEQLSKRLMLLPKDSLTPAVLAQLKVVKEKTRFPCAVAGPDEIFAFIEGLSEAQLDDLLVEVVKLSELMLAEVPCTMGCSNPLCTNLSGVSEMEVKAGSRRTVLKACTACNVVWYCSRECQVAHWKVHQPLCKRLQQQQKEQQEEEQQKGEKQLQRQGQEQ